LIKASQIIQTLESMANPKDDLDLFFLLHDLLQTWSEDWTCVVPAQLLLVKRHIPSVVYTGKAYRFLFIPYIENEVYDFYRDGSVLGSCDNMTNFRRYVLSHAKARGRLISWAKSIGGVDREIGFQGMGRKQNGDIYLISAVISGFDLSVAAEFLEALSHKIINKYGQSPFRLRGIDPTLSPTELLDDFSSSEEILAPMTSDFRLVAVFQPRDYRQVLSTLGNKER
jgi:hypothetical protein